MILLYLSETNLRDRLFVQNLVFNFKFQEKALILHDAFGGTVKDTRFVTKRLSTLMSEAMVYNNGFSADQRNLFYWEKGEIKVKTGLIEQLLAPIQALVVGPVLKGADGPELADPMAMIAAARQQLPISEIWVFTDNPLSPLGSKRTLIESEADTTPLLQVYEEEQAAILRALDLRPARLLTPNSMNG